MNSNSPTSEDQRGSEKSPKSIRRELLDVIDRRGPISHSELAEVVGVEWDELQDSIRGLRMEGKVCLTLDRRYDTMTDNETVDSIRLADLKGAVLTWTEPDGTERRVEFDE